MKKILILGALAVLTVAVIAAVVLNFTLGNAVTAGVNKFGPRFTGTTVVLEGASLSPLSGSGELHGLTIGNPEGWSGEKLMSVGKAHLSVAPASLLGDTLHIRKVVLEAPEFHYETRLLSSNLGDLLKNIEKATGSGGAAGGGAPAERGQRKFIIEHFMLKDAKVTLGLAGASLPVPVPDLDIKDLGVKEGGLTPAQLTLEVGQKLLTHVITSAVKAIANLETTKGVETLKGAARSVGEGVKRLFGGKSEEPPEKK